MSRVEMSGRRRRGRWLTGLLAFVLVVAVLLVVGDRTAAWAAQRQLARQVSTELARDNVSAAEPQVRIAGFPFLTQVLAGRYKKITIGLADVRGDVAGRTVSLPHLDIVARDVSATLDTVLGGAGKVMADSVAGTATIDYASLADLIGQPGLSLAEDGGRLTARMPVQVLGQRLTLTGSAHLSAGRGKVHVRFDELSTADGAVPAPVRAAIDGYASRLSVDIALPPLPFGLEVTTVRPLAGGLAITATATHVPLSVTG